MKTGRSIGIAASLLVVIIIAAVIYILSSLDAIVAGAIQKYGSQVTRTPVRVSSVSIDLKSGAGDIQQLTVLRDQQGRSIQYQGAAEEHRALQR
jgi:hypothetical protein